VIVFVAFLAFFTRTVGGDKPTVIVDTDAGGDDLLALAFLLAQPDVSIEAITVVGGLAHVPAGVTTVARLVACAGRPDIRVLAGADSPLEGGRAFPEAWRRQADDLANLASLPQVPPPPRADAVRFLVQRLADHRRPLRILALGPLTDLAGAIRRSHGHLDAVEDVVAMGGAFDVPGNAPADGPPTAEWNMAADPAAADIVLASGLRLMLVPLDATRNVPIRSDFVTAFRFGQPTPLGRVVNELLAQAAPEIVAGRYDAWDPLAAAVFLDPSLMPTRQIAVAVGLEGPEAGRTRWVEQGRPNARVGVEADPRRFTRVFFEALTRHLAE